jgi:hypothetical protein
MRFGLAGRIAYNLLSRVLDWIAASPDEPEKAEPTRDAFQTSPQDVSTDTLRTWATGHGYDALDPQLVDESDKR